MRKCVKIVVCLLLAAELLLGMAPVGSAYEVGEPYHLDLSTWIQREESREYVEMMLDHHLRNNDMVQDALAGGFSAVFLFDGCSDHLYDPELADLTYYRVTGVCVVLKLDDAGNLKMLYFNDNCSTIPDRPLEYGAWSLPKFGEVGPATVCDGTYQLYSVRHKGNYEALHVRTEYHDAKLDAVYMTSEGYVRSRANEVNVHTRTSNHTSSRGMWSAGCPLVGGGKSWEFWKLMEATYYSSYESFELDNFVGTLTIDRMPLRTRLYTLYEDPDAVDAFLKKSREIQPDTYLAQCSEASAWEEEKTMKAAMQTDLMTLPCSNATDARSRTQGVIGEGEKLQVLGSIQNNAGNVWYQVEYGGKIGYIYSRHLEKLGFLEGILHSIFH